VTRRPFLVIEGTPEPETPASATRRRMKAHETPADLITCPRCTGREFIETITGAMTSRSGKRVGGVKTLVCVPCLMTGRRVAIL
jgi:hypothetical protein